MTILKYTPCFGFGPCQTIIVEFIESTHTIYWPINIAKKQQTVEIIFLYMLSIK